MKVKVIKQFGDIEVGEYLILNPKTNEYEYANTNTDVSETSSYTTSSYLSMSIDIVESGIGEYFEYYADTMDWSKADYIKPIVLKAIVNEYNVSVKGIDGSIVMLAKDTFDKLFKIIQ